MSPEIQEHPLDLRREEEETVDAARRLVLGVAPPLRNGGAENGLTGPARTVQRHLRAARLQ